MRYRHDGFTAPKRRRFLKTLAKTGCIKDSARVAGISTTTVDRWRSKQKRFARACENAIDMASSHIETLAWERGVTGIEEPVWHYGKLVGTRLKRSDAIFRMLLIASNPKKYGRMGAAARTNEKKMRESIELEIQEDTHERAEEARENILQKLGNIRRAYIRKGWTEAADGSLVPPGWGPVSEEAKAAEAAAKREPPPEEEL